MNPTLRVVLITEPHKLGNHARTEKDVYEDIQNPEARNLNSKINVCVYCIYIYTQQLKIEFQADNLGGAHWRLAAQSEVQLSKKKWKRGPSTTSWRREKTPTPSQIYTPPELGAAGRSLPGPIQTRRRQDRFPNVPGAKIESKRRFSIQGRPRAALRAHSVWQQN